MVDALVVAGRHAERLIEKRALLERILQMFLPRTWRENEIAQIAQWVSDKDPGTGKEKSVDAQKVDRKKAAEFLKKTLKLTDEQAKKFVEGPDAHTMVDSYAKLVALLRQRGAVAAAKPEDKEAAAERRRVRGAFERLQATLWWYQDQLRFATAEVQKGRKLTPIMAEILDQAADFAWEASAAKEFRKVLAGLTNK